MLQIIPVRPLNSKQSVLTTAQNTGPFNLLDLW